MFRCMYCMYWVRLFLCVPFLYLGWSGSRPVGDLHSQVSPGEHDSSSQVLVGWPKHQFFHLTLDLDSIWKQWACFTWKTIAQTYPVRSSYFFVNQYLWFQYTCSPSCNQVNATTQVSLIFAHWLFGLWWHIQYGTWIDDRVMGQAGWVHTNISCDYIYIYCHCPFHDIFDIVPRIQKTLHKMLGGKGNKFGSSLGTSDHDSPLDLLMFEGAGRLGKIDGNQDILR